MKPSDNGKPEHSPIGASSMYRWSACSGSIRECEGKESPESSYAKEGTKAHDLGAKLLYGTPVTFQGYADEMLDAVDVYVRFVQKAVQPGEGLFIEHEIDLKALGIDGYGTADAVIWKPTTKRLIVVDFKYGAGIYVEVKNNLQLRYYALGALLTLGYPAETIEIVIVQPRYECEEGPIRSETFGVLDLLDFAADLTDAVKATEDPNAPLVSGGHCRFCPAAPSCPELFSITTEMAKLEFKSDLSYDPNKLKLAMDSIPAVQAWVTALNEFAYRQAEIGNCPPGYKLVAKRPVRKWKNEQNVVDAMSVIGVEEREIYEPGKLKTPAKLEKLKISKTVIGFLVEKVSGGHSLVPESDKRPSVRTSAKDDFLELETIEGG